MGKDVERTNYDLSEVMSQELRGGTNISRNKFRIARVKMVEKEYFTLITLCDGGIFAPLHGASRNKVLDCNKQCGGMRSQGKK